MFTSEVYDAANDIGYAMFAVDIQDRIVDIQDSLIDMPDGGPGIMVLMVLITKISDHTALSYTACLCTSLECLQF